MSPHFELHFLETAREAARIECAGLPRIDLIPHNCDSCASPVGEVIGQTDDVVSWIPCAIVLTEDGYAVICRRCLATVEKALTYTR